MALVAEVNTGNRFVGFAMWTGVVYRNKLVRIWWAGVTIASLCVVAFVLYVVRSAELQFPIAVLVAVVAIGVGVGGVIPRLFPKQDLPDRLRIEAGAMWAEFGPPELGHRVKLDTKRLVLLDGKPPSDVYAIFALEGGRCVRFRLAPESHGPLAKLPQFASPRN